MKTKILIVDDEPDIQPMMQQRFRTKIQQETYSITFAVNGQQALELIEQQPDFDVLLLDINMPEMDGLTLLGRLPDLWPFGKAVIVSAYSDMDNIRTAMNRGAFDFVCKPINFKDLESTIEKTALHVRHLRESAQIKAVAELKTRFYDNITHDFRTPLTLILASLEQMYYEYESDQEATRSLLSIERNARHLLRLVNQLLELAKLESGQLRVVPQPGNLGAFIGELVQAFVPLAEQRHIRLSYENHLPGHWMYDQEKTGQIAYNIIANAIKFTAATTVNSTTGKEGIITIGLHAGTMVQFTVADTGIGIAPADLPFIFDRFYQADNCGSSGTGIGLALVKELTGLMGGKVFAESNTANRECPSGTRFTVELPLVRSEDGDTSGSTFDPGQWFGGELPAPAYGAASLSPAEAPLLLLIEDNQELLAYLSDKLSAAYQVITAGDGELGWQLAQSELPDIIVSDITIPHTDGLTLTQLVKTTPATNHIAVVLLTARSTYDSRIKGLSYGADDYLIKPFRFEELSLRLHNLVTRQQRLRTFYKQQLTRPELPQPLETVQDEWLRGLYNVIETHIDNPSLNVEWLASQMGMSRKTLLRKVQSLTQLSPNELIRQYRLRKSIDVLQSGRNISEAAYIVGFETPAYFGKCFKELYHLTPSEYLISINNRSAS